MNAVERLSDLISHFCDPSSAGAEAWSRVRAIAEAVVDWRNAVCVSPQTAPSDPTHKEEECLGDNHLEECPCEVARQDLLDALNRLEAL